MAVTWVRGQRCGVNNCSSRFYQISGGHRVCQNGHVQEGFEAAADDDDFAAVGRRITTQRRPAKSTQDAAASKIVHGRKAIELTLSLMQDVLAAQVHWLRERIGLDTQYESAVRSLWAAYVSLMVSPKSPLASTPLTLRDVVVLCYLGLRVVHAPVLLIDFLRWIPLSDFPYVSSQKWLDTAQFERVPIEQRRVFTGLGTPTRLALHHRALVLRPHLERLLHTTIPKVDARYAISRLCRELMLPPEMYVGARALLRDIASAPQAKVWCSEDLPAVCALVVATKMAYGLDGLPRVLDESRKGEQIDWQVWRDVIRKTWAHQPNPTTADERLAMFWDDEAIDTYVEWQRSTILAEDPPANRLLAMFPLTKSAVPANYDTVDDETLTELTALVHSTSAPHEDVASEPDLDAGAGAYYQIYMSRKEMAEPLPDIIKALFETLVVLYNTDEEDVRNFVRGFEGWVRRAYGKLAYFELFPELATQKIKDEAV